MLGGIDTLVPGTLFFALAVAAPAAQERALLDLLALPAKGDRAKRVAELVRESELSAAGWEALLRKLPRPPFPLAGARAGRIQSRKAELEGSETAIAVFLPPGFDPKKRYPLLLACHGTGGIAESELSMWRRVASEVPMLCVGATDPGENTGYRFTAAERALELALLRWAKLHLPVDPDRVFVSGTSRGGHLAWDLATRYPDLWAGVAPFIGGPRLTIQRGQNNLRLVPNLWATALRDLQGEKDDPAMLFNLRLAFKTLEKAGARDAEFVTFPELGHSFELGKVDWNAFFAGKRRDPVPDEIRFSCVTPAQGRCSWFEALALDKKKVEASFTPRVKASFWAKLDENGRKHFLAEEADKRTARLRLTIARSERDLLVSGESSGFRRGRLLLPRALLDELAVADSKTRKARKLRVKLGKRVRLLRPTQNPAVMLADFAERLDLGTLPVAVAEFRL